MDFNSYNAIAQALVALFDPLVEVVIHDIATKKIVFIQGSLSKRQVGDASLVDEDLSSLRFEPYEKINFDGRLLRSISIPLQEYNKIVALICINYDVSIFQEMNRLTDLFLKKSITKGSDALFKNDWQERIHISIHEKLQADGLIFSALTQKDKKEFVLYLYKIGAFHEKNAANYIATVFKLSRATVFNYLRDYRKDHDEI